MAATAAAVDAGDLTPRIGPEASAAVEVRTLAEAFDHMLDRLDDAFSRQRQFVSDASHELRTPLTAIRGQLEVLARSDRPERRGGAPGRGRGADRDGADRTAGRRPAHPRPPRRGRAAASVARSRSRPSCGASPKTSSLGGVEVGELPAGTLHADPDRLTQVVRNLLANARRHAGPGGRVAISAAARGARLTIRVDDDGPGIAPAERERVFDRFHRSEAARDRGSGGSGLGLAIARSIVELHGGRIWVEDSPLGGARVAFELDGFEPQLGTA